MSRLVSRSESWEKVYTAFSNTNFAAFDYNTVKQSILDYIKLYFPETFNDFIESSEFIAIIESFAYIAEILAYRIDVTAHENFISTAQRRDSILKLAKLISYKVSRPLPARGLVKITSVSTTETLIDSGGNNLSGRTIRWNDTANSSWKDQFILVMNRVLDQDFGTVVASDRFQIQDVLFEIYPTLTTQGVLPYSASVYGQSVNMELVPVSKSSGDAFTGTTTGITERRPQTNAQFTIMYGSDGLGDASETTGFFAFTKQGTLQKYTARFDGITPNLTYDIPTVNVNDTDVWVNNVDATTGDIIVKTSNLPYRRESLAGKYGEWVEVDVAHSQNVIFNTNPKRNKYEVETVGNNKVRILFGDGEFADIPAGTFEIWARTSMDADLVVPQSSVVDVPLSISYMDAYNQPQTFSFTITLISSLQNASAAETTEHVRETAPAVYYTQDRMVNGEDYNTYLRQNPTILKLRAVNRTFAGDSKYITWHDGSNTYENVKIFGDDGLLYIQDKDIATTTPAIETNVLISTYVEPMLISTDIFMQLTTAGVSHTAIRRVLNANEKARLEAALKPPSDLRTVDMYYNTFANEWYSVKADQDLVPQLQFDGYQIINMNGFATSLDRPVVYSTNKPNVSAQFTINGGATFGVTIPTVSLPTTFGELIQQLNATFTTQSIPAVASLQFGNILITSTAYNGGVTSVLVAEPITATEGGLFSDIIISTQSSVTFEPPVAGYEYPTNFIATPLIRIRQLNEQDTVYTVNRSSRRIIFESQTTSFWNANGANRVMDYDTLRSSYDTISILQANVNCNRNGILKRNWNYNILGQEPIEAGPEAGIADIHRISVISTDENADRVPDHLNIEDSTTFMGLANIIKPKLTYTVTPTNRIITLPVTYIAGMGDVVVSGATFTETDVDGNTVGMGTPTSYIKIDGTAAVDVFVEVNEYVYFNRSSLSEPWIPMATTVENMLLYVEDYIAFHNLDATNPNSASFNRLWKRYLGRDNINFAWMHFSPRYQLVDPSPTNIIDIFVITRGYFISFKRWLEDPLALPPSELTPLDLRNDYNKLLASKMASDTVILHPGKFKMIFGDKSAPALQGKLKVIRSANSTMTDNQIKNIIVATVRNFFDISAFEFGETFFFTELASAIHMDLATEISSVVLVPTLSTSQFGDMLQVQAREDEIIYPDINVEDIDIVSGFTATNLRVNG